MAEDLALSKKRIPVLLVVLVDAFLVNAGIVLAFLARFSGHPPPVNFQAYLSLVLWITLIRIGTFYFTGLYDEKKEANPFDIFYLVFTSVTLSSIIIVALTFFYERTLPFPRTVFLISWLFSILIISAWHSYVHYLAGQSNLGRSLLIIGGREIAEKVRRETKAGGSLFTRIEEVRRAEETEEILGDLKKHLKGITDVILASPDLSGTEKLTLLSFCQEREIDIWMIPETSQMVMGRTQITHLGDIPLVRIDDGGLGGKNKTVKALVDVFFSLLILAFSLSLIPLISLIIKLDSRGPVLLKQDRVGLEGIIYRVYKVRSMIEEAEGPTGPILAEENDSRVTKVGAMLRKSRLDELPQIFNILKGEMSLVGPRPERSVFVERFNKEIPGYVRRFVVKPGITGLAQIYGRYDTSAENKLKFDLAYINNWSILVDLEIIFMTVEVILRGMGSR